MSYQVLARKWRPHSFSEMVGQEHILASLIHSLDQNRLHHAYLFTGSRGVGKTSVARIMAKCLNCEQGVTSKPCGQCGACREIDEGRFIDLIEIDAASRTKVEDTREILDNVQYAPSKGRFKVYLIDEVHMLSSHSFNALLKTLEEPPEHVKFLLATTEPKKLPVTVLSRCLQFYLKDIPQAQIIDRLAGILKEEAIDYEAEGLALIARAATGSLRDALSLLDQAIAYSSGSLKAKDCQQMLGMMDDQRILEIANALFSQDVSKIQEQLSAISAQSTNFTVLLDSLSRLFYEISLAQLIPTLDEFDYDKAAVHALAKSATKEQVQLMYQISIKAKQDLPWAPDVKTGFEMALLRMYAFAPVCLGQNQPQAPQHQKSNPQLLSQTTPQAAAAQELKTQDSNTHEPVSPKASVNMTEAHFDWAAVSQALKLTGLAKQVVAHCSLHAFANNELKLLLEAQHASLLSDTMTQKIQKALSEYCARPIHVTIDLGEVVNETPAAIRQEAAENRQQAAETAITQDELANFIQSEFNASVDPGSIQPLSKER